MLDDEITGVIYSTNFLYRFHDIDVKKRCKWCKERDSRVFREHRGGMYSKTGICIKCFRAMLPEIENTFLTCPLCDTVITNKNKALDDEKFKINDRIRDFCNECYINMIKSVSKHCAMCFFELKDKSRGICDVCVNQISTERNGYILFDKNIHDDECPICLDGFSSSEYVFMLHVGSKHVICETCNQKMKIRKCPLCRVDAQAREEKIGVLQRIIRYFERRKKK